MQQLHQIRRPFQPISCGPLPVDANWTCRRSGDCCTMPEGVIMTTQEQAALIEVAEKVLTIKRLVSLKFTPAQEMGFVLLEAGPCPLLDRDGKGRPVCSVYHARPFNCRRFACLRPDPKTEPLRLAPLSPVLRYGNVGCSNVRERLLQSRVARRLYEVIQRHSKRWGLSHGWRLE